MSTSARAVVPTAVVALVLIAVFLAAGLYTHRYAALAADATRHVYDVRSLTSDALKLQLDEEVGIRGLAATGDRTLLQPFAAAKAPLEHDFSELRVALAGLDLPEARAALDRAATENHTWLRQVAEPTLLHPHRGAASVQRYGKKLVDAFRADIARVDALLTERATQLSQRLTSAIDRITVLVVGVVIALSVAALAYTVQQVRAARRVAEGERLADQERAQRATLQAAYDAEKRIADSLQTAFSQRPLPALEALRFSASYVPATEETKLGGDWYDVIALPGNKVLFTIGDVTGHGIDAAVTMNRARQSFVTGALFDLEPSSVLERVNNEMAAREDRLVTAIAGVADAGTFEFVYAIAGHPPPVLLEPGRRPRFLDCGSLPLGGFPNTKYAGKRVQSVPGATLVLYTDGAVEHSRNVVEGEELLLSAVATSADHPEVDPATWIHQAIFQGRAVGDDVAILTVGFSADPAVGFVVSADKAQSGFSGRMPGNTQQRKSVEARRLARMPAFAVERAAS